MRAGLAGGDERRVGMSCEIHVYAWAWLRNLRTPGHRG